MAQSTGVKSRVVYDVVFSREPITQKELDEKAYSDYAEKLKAKVEAEIEKEKEIQQKIVNEKVKSFSNKEKIFSNIAQNSEKSRLNTVFEKKRAVNLETETNQIAAKFDKFVEEKKEFFVRELEEAKKRFTRDVVVGYRSVPHTIARTVAVTDQPTMSSQNTTNVYNKNESVDDFIKQFHTSGPESLTKYINVPSQTNLSNKQSIAKPEYFAQFEERAWVVNHYQQSEYGPQLRNPFIQETYMAPFKKSIGDIRNEFSEENLQVLSKLGYSQDKINTARTPILFGIDVAEGVGDFVISTGDVLADYVQNPNKIVPEVGSAIISQFNPQTHAESIRYLSEEIPRRPGYVIGSIAPTLLLTHKVGSSVAKVARNTEGVIINKAKKIKVSSEAIGTETVPKITLPDAKKMTFVNDIHHNEILGDVRLEKLEKIVHVNEPKTTNITRVFPEIGSLKNFAEGEGFISTQSITTHWGLPVKGQFYGMPSPKDDLFVGARQFGAPGFQATNTTSYKLKFSLFPTQTQVFIAPRNVTKLSKSKNISDLVIDASKNELSSKTILPIENVIRRAEEPQVYLSQAQGFLMSGQKVRGAQVNIEKRYGTIHFYDKIDFPFSKKITDIKSKIQAKANEKSFFGNLTNQAMAFYGKTFKPVINSVPVKAIKKGVLSFWDKSGLGRNWKTFKAYGISISNPRGRPPKLKKVPEKPRVSGIIENEKGEWLLIQEKDKKFSLIGGDVEPEFQPNYYKNKKIMLKGGRWVEGNPEKALKKSLFEEMGLLFVKTKKLKIKGVGEKYKMDQGFVSRDVGDVYLVKSSVKVGKGSGKHDGAPIKSVYMSPEEIIKSKDTSQLAKDIAKKYLQKKDKPSLFESKKPKTVSKEKKLSVKEYVEKYESNYKEITLNDFGKVATSFSLANEFSQNGRELKNKDQNLGRAVVEQKSVQERKNADDLLGDVVDKKGFSPYQPSIKKGSGSIAYFPKKTKEAGFYLTKKAPKEKEVKIIGGDKIKIPSGYETKHIYFKENYPSMGKYYLAPIKQKIKSFITPTPRAKLKQKIVDEKRLKKLSLGYAVFSRVKGRQVKITNMPLPKNLAVKTGSSFAKKTIARSFTLKPIGITTLTDINEVDLKQFRPGKSKKLKGFFVEKAKHAIDTKSEIVSLAKGKNKKRDFLWG